MQIGEPQRTIVVEPLEFPLFKHKMKLISDLLNKTERQLSEELDARPKVDMTIEQIGCLGEARCGTLLRKMPMRLNVTLEQEEAIRARYASLVDAEVTSSNPVED